MNFASSVHHGKALNKTEPNRTGEIPNSSNSKIGHKKMKRKQLRNIANYLSI